MLNSTKVKIAVLLSSFLFALSGSAACAVIFSYPGPASSCSAITIVASGAIECSPVVSGQAAMFQITGKISCLSGLAITADGKVSCATTLPECKLTVSSPMGGPGDTVTFTASGCTNNPTAYSWTGNGLVALSTVAPTNTAALPPNALAGPYSYSVTAINAAGAGAITEAIVNVAIAGYRGPYAYIVHTANGVATGTLSVVDTTAKLENSIFKSVPVQANPVGVAVNPAGSRVYVTNSGSNSVSVIETGKHTVVPVADPSNIGSTIPYIGLGIGKTPWGIAVSTSGDKVYVANSGDNSVSVIDAASNTVSKNNVPVGGKKPYGIAVNPKKPRLYVTNYDDNSVAVIDTGNDSFLTLVNLNGYSFNKPYGIAVDPAGNYVYVVNKGDGATLGTVSVIDAVNDKVIHSANVGKGPTGVAVSPAGDKVYVVNSSDHTVSVIDTAKNYAVTTAIDSGGILSEYIALNPAGVIAYVTHFDSGDISVIDIASNNVIDVAPTDSTVATIPARNHPYALGNFVGPAISAVESEFATAYEYYHAGLNHYFMTANSDEAKALDVVTTAPTWQRTGKTWLVWKSAASSLTPACRFFGTDKYDVNLKRIGANSHFYTADSAECDFVKNAYRTLANDGSQPLEKDGLLYPAWTYEENAYYAVATAGACPSGTTPIYRLYNNGQGGQPNHRYYIDAAVKTEMLGKGWVAEPSNGNPVMCGPPQ